MQTRFLPYGDAGELRQEKDRLGIHGHSLLGSTQDFILWAAVCDDLGGHVTRRRAEVRGHEVVGGHSW